MGKWDDTGIFSPNKYKKTDKHPTHTGVINIGYDTLKALNLAMKENGEAKLEVAGWRKRDKPDMISLKISLPKEQNGEGRSSRGRDRDDDDRGERSRGSYRRDDDREEPRRESRRSAVDMDDDEIPFDERRSARRDDDRRGDDRGERRGRSSDYGDERDL